MKKFFGKIKNWFISHAPTKRRIIQLYSALLHNAYLKGFITGDMYKGSTKNVCFPGLNCYSCPGAIGACPLGSLQNALGESSVRTPTYVLGILALFALMLGRTICGWLCPVGLGQDLLYKIKTPKIKKSKATRVLSYLKYFMLIVLVVIVPLMFAVPGFCEYICPAGTVAGILSFPNNPDWLADLGPFFTWKFTLLIVIIVLSIFCYRTFCRFLCPLGALYGFFNKIALLGVKLDKNKCTDCGLCQGVCPMDIKKVGDHECISCGKCISVCPAKAISWKGSKLFVRKNDTDMPAQAESANLLGMVKPKEEAVENVAPETTVQTDKIAENTASEVKTDEEV
ncbi:MAG: 4Fe-4S binding protein [Clostridia bacterium]|nr:4Fe-4S binding protein [Clostridia bacterium]